jgi:hypothetical protein
MRIPHLVMNLALRPFCEHGFILTFDEESFSIPIEELLSNCDRGNHVNASIERARSTFRADGRRNIDVENAKQRQEQ